MTLVILFSRFDFFVIGAAVVASAAEAINSDGMYKHISRTHFGVFIQNHCLHIKGGCFYYSKMSNLSHLNI